MICVAGNATFKKTEENNLEEGGSKKKLGQGDTQFRSLGRGTTKLISDKETHIYPLKAGPD